MHCMPVLHAMRQLSGAQQQAFFTVVCPTAKLIKVDQARVCRAQVPDLVSSIMNRGLPRNMTLPEGVGGLTKLGFQAMFTAASHI